MEIKGIDVSAYQGNIDWEKVADYGMGFAILRITEKGNKTDSTFEQNYKGCTQHGIPVGVYKYSYAKSPAQAEQEAESVLKVLNKCRLNFPVFYDLEWSEQRKLGSAAVEKIALAFLNKIQAAGYQGGIYCNLDWYQNVLTKALKNMTAGLPDIRPMTTERCRNVSGRRQEWAGSIPVKQRFRESEQRLTGMYFIKIIKQRRKPA